MQGRKRVIVLLCGDQCHVVGMYVTSDQDRVGGEGTGASENKFGKMEVASLPL